MPSPPHDEQYGDPFADRPRQTHFQDPPPRIYENTSGSPFESTTTLPREFGGNDVDEDYAEKLPLTAGDGYNPGGFYPPG
jgi:chitin synthase